jgi:hypothetical protein
VAGGVATTGPSTWLGEVVAGISMRLYTMVVFLLLCKKKDTRENTLIYSKFMYVEHLQEFAISSLSNCDV